MSFFKHVKLHEYDITDLGIRQACYDELIADGNNSDDKQLRILAHAMCEEFKDYMRRYICPIRPRSRVLLKSKQILYINV